MYKTTDFVVRGMRSYALETCQERSIPDARDGLKDSQRIAMWIAMGMADKKTIKTASLYGNMIGENLYVHGEASAAETVCFLAAEYLNTIPILTGKGNFGTLTTPRDMGAPRYTSISVPDFTKNFIYVDKDIHKMVPSVDGDTSMCDLFYPLIPLALFNGSQGTAVGYSTYILPHSLEDMKSSIIRKIKGETIPNMLPHFAKYDVDIEHIEGLSYRINGKVKVVNTTTVEILSAPPSLAISDLLDKLEALVDKKSIKSYENYITDTFKIVVKMTREDLSKHTEESLIKLFGITSRVTERLTMVNFDGETIRTFDSHDEYLGEWVAWRSTIYRKRFEKILRDLMKELTHIQNILKCFEANLPSKLKGLASKKALEDLIENICGVPDTRISEFASYRWTVEHHKKAKEKLKSLEAEVKKVSAILADEGKQTKIFIDEVEKVCQ